MKKTPPKSVLVAWCPHCGALDAIVTAEEKKRWRLSVGTCSVCVSLPRNRRRREWVTYAIPLGGVCRECGCTDLCGCPEGCGWADKTHTLCTRCAEPPPPARDARAQARAKKKLARARGAP